MREMQVHPGDAARAWEAFPGSPLQRALHNEMLIRLNAKRNALESCAPEDLAKLQGEIAELKKVLGLIHSKDSVNLKATYE